MLIYDMSNAMFYDSLINPKTNSNVPGYILRKNNTISFNWTKPTTAQTNLIVREYYLETLPNRKVVKIMLREAVTLNGISMDMLPKKAYSKLIKDTNKKDKLFVIEVSYNTNEGDVGESNVVTQKFYFTLLDDIDYNAYLDMKSVRER